MKQYPLFRYVRPIIAFVLVIGTLGFVYLLAYRSVPISNADVINILVGALVANLLNVTNYYFGSSKDKSDSEQAERGNSTTTNN